MPGSLSLQQLKSRDPAQETTTPAAAGPPKWCGFNRVVGCTVLVLCCIQRAVVCFGGRIVCTCKIVLLGEIREGPACTKARQDESQKQEVDNSQMPATRTTAVQLSETNPARPSGTVSDEKQGRVPTAGSTRQTAGPGVGPSPRAHHLPNNSAAIMRPGDQIPGAARPSPRNRTNAAPP